MDSEDLQAALAKFTRSLKHYRHWSRAYFYTDGVAFLAGHAGAYWLLDHIAARQKLARKDRMLRDAQVWTLRMTGPITAHVSCNGLQLSEFEVGKDRSWIVRVASVS